MLHVVIIDDQRINAGMLQGLMPQPGPDVTHTCVLYNVSGRVCSRLNLDSTPIDVEALTMSALLTSNIPMKR
jgi:hypothetical protein